MSVEGRPLRQDHRPARPFSADVPLVIAAGGALGAVARYGVSVALPAGDGSFPWATFWTNVAGCLAIGVLMVLVTEGRPHRLARPFVGVGVLGGFTTFSTYSVDAVRLVESGSAGTALVYTFGTLAAALVAVEVGMAMTRWVSRARRTRKDGRR